MTNIKEYAEISQGIWRLFQKYFPDDVKLDTFADEVHALDVKYRERTSCAFMRDIIKAYFDELNRRKQK